MKKANKNTPILTNDIKRILIFCKNCGNFLVARETPTNTEESLVCRLAVIGSRYPDMVTEHPSNDYLRMVSAMRKNRFERKFVPTDCENEIYNAIRKLREL